MVRSIRVRLALSYAGIALLVTLSLGAVLLVRLRAYYTGMEREYMMSNAKAISAMAVPLLAGKYPEDVQKAQVNNLAFLSQMRVRILDAQKNVLADSGPWQARQIGLGVLKARKQVFLSTGASGGADSGEKQPPASSVIVIQERAGDAAPLSGPLTAPPLTAPPPIFGESQSAPAGGGAAGGASVVAGGGAPDVVYFNAAVPVSRTVYGFDLNNTAVEFGPRSDQMVEQSIRDASGAPLGYVELSESPAYGRDIVWSVASGLAVAGGLAILLAIGTGWFASRRFLMPLVGLTQATLQMSGGDLSVRVAEANRADEFGSLGKSFNQMAGRIEETVGTLRRFLSDAAHELQTPLTALRTNLELARSEANSAPTEQYLAHALEQIDRLQRMIKDLLSLSRLESANGQEPFQQVDLSALVREVSELYAARAEQAGQSFALDLPDAPALVMGSPEKLGCALGNLLDNALKFTPSGGAVTVRLRETAEDVRLEVADTGIGIPAEEIEMLFNRFHRGRNASAYPGSGLGLAIVQAIAQAHVGRVEAENNPQGGACFRLILKKEI